MKAAIYTQYGAPEVLQLSECPKPVPKSNEILVRILATAVNSGDCRLRKADPWAVRLFFGLMKPWKQILGGVFSGEVEAVGEKVTKYMPGDLVFGATGMSFGAYAEYKCLPENGILSLKPENITHSEAAVIPFGGATALHFIRKAQVLEGQKVVVYGASGAVGTAAVQLAKYFGAEVTAVCSGANHSLALAIGADHVIDYTRQDFTENGQKYDVIYEAVNKLSYARSIRSLKKGGVLILGAAGFPQMLRAMWTSMTSRNKVLAGVISQDAATIHFLKTLIESGDYKPVVDRTYTLEQIVEAHRYAEQGHKKGNVAITIK